MFVTLLKKLHHRLAKRQSCNKKYSFSYIYIYIYIKIVVKVTNSVTVVTRGQVRKCLCNFPKKHKTIHRFNTSDPRVTRMFTDYVTP